MSQTAKGGGDSVDDKSDPEKGVASYQQFAHGAANFAPIKSVHDFISESSGTSRSFHAVRFLLFKNLNYHMEFNDDELKDQYYIFRTASTSPVFAFGVALFVLICFVIYWPFVYSVYISPISITLGCVSFIFGIVLFWILIYFRCFIPLAEQQTDYRAVIVTLESIVSIGVVVTCGLVLVMRSFRRCPSQNFEDRWSCSPGYDTHGIPGDIPFVLMFSPLIFSVVFPFMNFAIVYLCQALAIAITLFCLIYRQAYASAVYTALLIGLSLFLLIVYRLQQMELFLYTTKYYEALKEQTRQERRMAARLSNEMKCLISSVSHDLKSVRFQFLVLFYVHNFTVFSIFLIALAPFCVYSRI
jgi:ABC-type multidrug transport system fused ATPase/permease subunit